MGAIICRQSRAHTACLASLKHISCCSSKSAGLTSFCCPARFPNKETNILIACSDGKAYSMDALVALDEAGYINLAGRLPAGQPLPSL